MFRMVDVIQKKRDGQSLSKEEIEVVINQFTNKQIPDYQMSALLMAIYLRGMTDEEITYMTMAMVHSGDRIDLSEISEHIVDKHSTGGVGDKLTLIISPLVASLGLPVVKMSGRGLGHTGGTVDKLESIKGFHIELSKDQLIENVKKHQIAVVGQSGNLTPADKMIYALRDVTATVESIPLIASSIMSKKIAAGASAIVLDVKVGSGAFMKTLEDARLLAQKMVAIGTNVNRKTVAVLTDMNQPLGYEVGNANEVKEAIEVLKGAPIADLKQISLTIASQMAVLGGVQPDVETAYSILEGKMKSGEAVEKFRELIEAQGGNGEIVNNPDLLPQASYHIPVHADRAGYIQNIEAEQIGIGAMMLGAGRKKKEDRIDYAAGITLTKKVGDWIEKNDPLCILHTNKEDIADVRELITTSFTISEEKPAEPAMIYEIIQS